MGGKIERADYRHGTGEKEGQSRENRIEVNPAGGAGDVRPQFTPLLVDANQGAKILGISLSHFYVFMRKNKTIHPVAVGSLKMWRRKDLSRLTGKPCDPHPGSAEDILIDVVEIGALCSISRSLVYKLNDLEMMPEPILDGRTLRWSFWEIREWVDAGCPKRDERGN